MAAMEGASTAAASAAAAVDAKDMGEGSVRQQVVDLVREALAAIAPGVEAGIHEPKVTISEDADKGDYQCNNAMAVYSRMKGQAGVPFQSPHAVGQALVAHFPRTSLTASLSVSGPGYVNISLSDRWIETKLHQLLLHGTRAWAPQVFSSDRVVVDFSSPNIAKEMHVGHLRSTILGDSLCRMLEFCGAEVLRRNHVGDWGTQFGMLIALLFEQFPNGEEIGSLAVDDLQAFYKEAKMKFDSDPTFKESARKAVVLLQGGDPKYRAAWAGICEVSRQSFTKLYHRLNIVDLEEKGESFYNQYIARVIQELNEKGLVENSDGARVIRVSGHENPLILVKKDGGFNYDTTDMAALWYRLNEEKADVVLYITDVGQSQHFKTVFAAAKRAGWLPGNDSDMPQAKHVGFGLVLDANNKRIQTRSSNETTKLATRLDQAKEKSKTKLKNKLAERGCAGEWTEQELEKAAEILGCGAVKYADLKNNRLTNYKYIEELMFQEEGDTAAYLLYAYARICSIVRKSGKRMEEAKQAGRVQLLHPSERALGLQLIRFCEVVEDATKDFVPHLLCEYLYAVARVFTEFYTECRVVGSEQEDSRLLLCEGAAVIMRECFSLLGIQNLSRL